MQITRIERQKHNTERFSIFLDEQYAFSLGGVDVLYYKLVVGLEITEELYDYLMDEVLFKKAREKAIHFLGYRARSRKEMIDKLKEEEYPEVIIDKVLDMLESYNYINDYSFAESYTKTRIKSKGIGLDRIKYELRTKGINSNTIHEVLENLTDELEIDEDELCLAKLKKRARDETDLDEGDKRRLYQYLLRQGFTYDIVNRCFKKYFSDDID